MTRAVKSYFHRGGIEPLLGKTIPEHFADIVRRYPEQEAVVAIAQNRRLSYGELDKEIKTLAKGCRVVKLVGTTDYMLVSFGSGSSSPSSDTIPHTTMP